MAKSNIKKIIKYVGYTAAIFVMFIAMVLIYIVYQLPSLKTITSGLAAVKSADGTGAKISAASIEQSAVDTRSESLQDNPYTVSQATSVSSTEAAVIAKSNTLDSPEAFKDLFDESKPLSNFCGSLKNAKKGAIPSAEVGRIFQESVNTETADPRVQAMKPFMRYVLRLPNMRSLVDTAIELGKTPVGNQEESFIDKASFYAKVALAFNDLNSYKSDYEAIADRSYLQFKLSQVVALKPEMLNDQRVVKFCEDIERAFNTSQSINIEQEKNEFERLISELGVSPESIQYNSSYKTIFTINKSDKNLNLTGGWLSEVFMRDQEIKARQ